MHAHVSSQPHKTAYLDIEGIRVRYRVAGSGEQVLLLHGWGGSIESMAWVFDDLATDYAVTAVDFPGHGESDLPPTAWDVSDFSAFVLRLMARLHLQRPHIVAHSHGGRVTIKLASLWPAHVGKLVLVNSAGVRPPQSLSYYVRVGCAKVGKYLAAYGGRFGVWARQRIYHRIASADYVNAGQLRDTFVKIVNEDLTSILPQVVSPTLLVWGENDTETPVACARVMARLIPHAKLVILKHAGHFSYIDQFGKFRLIVRKFLRT